MESIEQKCKAVNKIFSNFRAAFVQKEKHSKCLRCKGSGLMDNAWQSQLKRGYASKEPCWFCEGVGILPIIGLNGFLLARASSHINTHDLMVRSLSPISVGQSLVNDIGTKSNCKITRCKPAVQISKFTPHNSKISNLGFLSNHTIYDTLYSLSNPIQVKDEMATHKECTENDVSKASDKSYNANSKLYIQKDLDILKSSVEVQPEVFLGPVTLGSQKNSQYYRSGNIDQVEKGSETSKLTHFTQIFGGMFSPGVFLIESALKLGLQNKTFGLQTCSFDDSVLTESGKAAHILSDVALPSVGFNKINRNSRRKRNRIREKAQKEANENARRILQSLTPRTTNVFTAPPNETPEDAPVVISTKGDKATNIHVGSETSKRLPFFRFRHKQLIVDRTSPSNLPMKNVGVQLLKKKGLTLAKPARTLKN